MEVTRRIVPEPDYKKGIPELLEFIAKDDIQVELRKINKHLERQESVGELSEAVLAVTDQEQCYSFLANYPFLMLVSGSLINDGLNSAFIGINNNAQRFEIKPTEVALLDRKGAKERVALIYYQCNPGLTTTVRVNGRC